MACAASLFRSAMAHAPIGVAVSAAQDSEDQLIGICISSFSCVSIDRPRVLFNLDYFASAYMRCRGGSHYAVNVLSKERQQVRAM